MANVYLALVTPSTIKIRNMRGSAIAMKIRRRRPSREARGGERETCMH